MCRDVGSLPALFRTMSEVADRIRMLASRHTDSAFTGLSRGRRPCRMGLQARSRCTQQLRLETPGTAEDGDADRPAVRTELPVRPGTSARRPRAVHLSTCLRCSAILSAIFPRIRRLPVITALVVWRPQDRLRQRMDTASRADACTRDSRLHATSPSRIATGVAVSSNLRSASPCRPGPSLPPGVACVLQPGLPTSFLHIGRMRRSAATARGSASVEITRSLRSPPRPF